MTTKLNDMIDRWSRGRQDRRTAHEVDRLSPNARDEYLDYLAAQRRHA